METNQDSLVARLRAGEHAAAGELVERYYEQIYLYFRRLGHGRQTSEDLTQDCFFQAWQHVAQLRSEKALNSWLYHIASNVSRLYWRRHKGERTGCEDFVVQAADKSGDDTEGFEELERVKEGVGKLPRKLREAVVLHYMQYLTISDAAEAAGVAEGTFKSRLARALKALRKHMG